MPTGSHSWTFLGSPKHFYDHYHMRSFSQLRISNTMYSFVIVFYKHSGCSSVGNPLGGPPAHGP
ncbi:hypothetical protein NQ317_008124 [Molorchus minor]|uniref:Uncharacterized protein n=1 Tax=Molorchus minor TaxID=1323400 RepID=A0ABQ9IXZ4_9CUCU|nr:hypothetical protein NQ317_008124 [Molorchus minor]